MDIYFKNTTIICVILLLFSGFTIGSEERSKPDKPNIILIMADDLGYETLGSYGGISYDTPHLDKMASEGMRFTHAYSTPLCTPSRIQIMTGKYNFRNYIGFGMLDPAERTFGHLLKDAGYATAIAGKWQLLGNDHQQELAGNRRGTWPTETGFDAYSLWQVHERGSRYKDPRITSKTGTMTHEDQYGPDRFLNFIEGFMERNKKGPFFIYYPMVLTHSPFQPTPDNQKFANLNPEKSVNDTTYFGEMVTYMDKIVGRIIEITKGLGIEENTLILFVGDNGTDRNVVSRMEGNKTIPGMKGHTTEYGTHVPFIAYWKDHIKGGRVNTNLVDFTDFVPSLMEAAQIMPPDDFNTDGISFYPQLIGESSTPREWVFGHYDPRWSKWSLKRYVHDKQWKLYGNGEIYNIKKDPMERKPLLKNKLSAEEQVKIKKFGSILKRLQ